MSHTFFGAWLCRALFNFGGNMDKTRKKEAPVDEIVANIYHWGRRIKLYGLIIMIILIIIGIISTIVNTYEAYHTYIEVADAMEKIEAEEAKFFTDYGLLFATLSSCLTTLFKYFLIVFSEALIYNVASALVIGYGSMVHCRYTDTNIALQEYKNKYNSDFKSENMTANISTERLYEIERLYKKGFITKEEFEKLLHNEY